MLPLKALSQESVAAALAKAERYRLLNEPAEAESICRDILAVEPGNQEARVILVLAHTDQIPHDKRAFQKAVKDAAELAGPYERAYYTGIAWERRAKAAHTDNAPGSGHTVYEWISKALDHFEDAERLRPQGNDDAVLRWNTCVRFLQHHPNLGPRSVEVPEAIVSE